MKTFRMKIEEGRLPANLLTLRRLIDRAPVDRLVFVGDFELRVSDELDLRGGFRRDRHTDAAERGVAADDVHQAGPEGGILGEAPFDANEVASIRARQDHPSVNEEHVLPPRLDGTDCEPSASRSASPNSVLRREVGFIRVPWLISSCSRCEDRVQHARPHHVGPSLAEDPIRQLSVLQLGPGVEPRLLPALTPGMHPTIAAVLARSEPSSANEAVDAFSSGTSRVAITDELDHNVKATTHMAQHPTGLIPV